MHLLYTAQLSDEDGTTMQSPNKTKPDTIVLCSLLLTYTIIYGPSVFAQVSSSEFMGIDARSIMDSLDGLLSSMHYNMNEQYHSQFYGWTYFSLNFFVLLFTKAIGFNSEIAINVTVRAVLFLIGGATVFYAFRLARRFFTTFWSTILVAMFLTNHVAAHYFVEIHPEALGTLLQLMAVYGLVKVYGSNTFRRRDFYLAVVCLSLSALCKQPYLIVGIVIYFGFFVSLARRTPVGDGISWRDFYILTVRSVAIFALTLFLIHPYALLEPARFLTTQIEVSGALSAPPFSSVAALWGHEIVSNFVVAASFVQLAVLFIARATPLLYKLCVIFSCLVAALFISKVTRQLGLNLVLYLYPIYPFLFFNAFYFLVHVALPALRKSGSNLASSLISALGFGALLVVISVNLLFAVKATHERYLLDGLSTYKVVWDKVSGFPDEAKIVFSPDVAILEPFKSNGCSAWAGCGTVEELEEFSPDYVVFSPSYEHFDGSVFTEFVQERNYTLTSEVKTDALKSTTRCLPTFRFPDQGLPLSYVKAILRFYVVNPVECISAYGSNLEDYRMGRIVEGLTVQIYEKR